MPTVDEVRNGPQSQLDSTLEEGVEFISQVQRVVFTLYMRVVLPLDGYVFWVKASLLKPGFALNQMAMNTQTPLNAARSEAARLTKTLVASGSIHYQTETVQDASEAYSRNTVMFTSEQPVQDLNLRSPNLLYIGTIDGIKFAFGQRGAFYRQANLYHYRGTAIYSIMGPLIVDHPNTLDTVNRIASNSLPIWLALQPPIPIISLPVIQQVPLFPAYLVPTNLPPVYGAVEVLANTTKSLQYAPTEGPTGTRVTLTQETVRITLYGLRNDAALDFVNYLEHYSLFTEAFGLMSTPTIHDPQVPQLELGILSMKKVIEFDVCYYQTRVMNLAREFVREAFAFQMLLEDAAAGLVLWDDPRLAWDTPGLSWDEPFLQPIA